MLLPPRSKKRKHFRNPCVSLPSRILLTPFCPSSKYSDFCSNHFLAFVCSFTLSVHIFKQHCYFCLVFNFICKKSHFQLCFLLSTSCLWDSCMLCIVQLYFLQTWVWSGFFQSPRWWVHAPWCGSIEGFPSFSIITPNSSLSPEDALCFCLSLCPKPGISSYPFILTYSLTPFSRYNKSVFLLCSITLYALPIF